MQLWRPWPDICRWKVIPLVKGTGRRMTAWVITKIVRFDKPTTSKASIQKLYKNPHYVGAVGPALTLPQPNYPRGNTQVTRTLGSLQDPQLDCSTSVAPAAAFITTELDVNKSGIPTQELKHIKQETIMLASPKRADTYCTYRSVDSHVHTSGSSCHCNTFIQVWRSLDGCSTYTNWAGS